MKKILLVCLILSITCTPLYAMGDKEAHFCVSFLGTLILREVFHFEHAEIGMLTVGVAKELSDDCIDWGDLGADALGVGLASVIHF